MVSPVAVTALLEFIGPCEVIEPGVEMDPEERLPDKLASPDCVPEGLTCTYLVANDPAIFANAGTGCDTLIVFPDNTDPGILEATMLA